MLQPLDIILFGHKKSFFSRLFSFNFSTYNNYVWDRIGLVINFRIIDIPELEINRLYILETDVGDNIYDVCTHTNKIGIQIRPLEEVLSNYKYKKIGVIRLKNDERQNIFDIVNNKKFAKIKEFIIVNYDGSVEITVFKMLSDFFDNYYLIKLFLYRQYLLKSKIYGVYIIMRILMILGLIRNKIITYSGVSIDELLDMCIESGKFVEKIFIYNFNKY